MNIAHFKQQSKLHWRNNSVVLSGKLLHIMHM